MDLNITQETDGYTADGLPLSIFTLGNRHGMVVRISTRGGALLGLHVPDRHGQLANVLRSGLASDGIHLLPAPGRALHRLAWHAVPLVEDACIGVRLVSPGAPAVVAYYTLDDANTLTWRCEVAGESAQTLSLPLGFNLAGAAEQAAGSHLLQVAAERVVPVAAHEQPVPGTPWDYRAARPVAELPGPARYLTGGTAPDGEGQRPVLLLAEAAGGRQLELLGDPVSLRVSGSEAPGCLLLEPTLAAPGGRLALRFSAQA